MYALIFAGSVLFLSTLSLRRATPGKIRILNDIFNFYPRSPCGERLYGPILPIIFRILFLSTLSLRRATTSERLFIPSHYFYPRSPCGERLHYDNYNLHCVEISIHALLAESDHYDNYNLHCVEISIHALLAESDASWSFVARKGRISIHALLAESD